MTDIPISRLRMFAGPNHEWLAEITNGETLEFKSNSLPNWFQTYVLDRL